MLCHFLLAFYNVKKSTDKEASICINMFNENINTYWCLIKCICCKSTYVFWVHLRITTLQALKISTIFGPTQPSCLRCINPMELGDPCAFPVFLGGVDQVIPLMVQKSGDHQLRLVVHPIIYRVLYIPSGCLGFLPSTVVSKGSMSCKTEVATLNKWGLWRLIIWGYDI